MLLPRFALLPATLLLLAAAACHRSGPSQPQHTGQTTPQHSASALPPGYSEATPGAPPPPVKQVVLIYTGDTLSELQTINGTNPQAQLVRGGGLAALTADLFSYEAAVTDAARQSLLAEGGDASHVRTDTQKGLLGDNPFFLLDYGGWERSTDPEGAPYVALQMRMYKDMNYHAVGCQLYDRLPDARWQDYAKLNAPACLVNSAGPQRPGTLPTVPVVTREAYGALWGVASVPLPAQDTPDGAQVQQYVDQAAAALEKAGCRFRILLCKGGPKSLYQKLSKDKRFTVVVGVSPRALAEPEGYGKVRDDGPVMLPELAWGGQEFGTCSLIYPTDGNAPTQFNFQRHKVVDDMKSPFPYRKQAAQAMAERQQLVHDEQAAQTGAGKIAAP